MRTYIAYVHKDPQSSFGVSFPDLPGCYGAGESYDEALDSAKTSLREYAKALADDGQDMPDPRTYSQLSSDTTEAVEFDRAAFIAEVPLITVGVRRRVNVSLDNRLLSAIDHACKLAGVTRSAFLSEIASSWMQANMNAVITPAGKRKRKHKSIAAFA